jgi:hypothetical protein
MTVAQFKKLRWVMLGVTGSLLLGTMAAPSAINPLLRARPPYPFPVSLAKAAPDDTAAIWRTKHTKRLTYKHYRPFTEGELSEQLSQLTELRFDNGLYPDASRELAILGRKEQDKVADFLPNVLLEREDLRVLPLRLDRFRLDQKEAGELSTSSLALRVQLNDCKKREKDGASILRAYLATNGGIWRQASAVSTLEQILQGEEKDYRVLMVEALGAIEDRKATLALARSAIFDLAEEVCTAAIQELAERAFEEYRAVLLAGLRYPWPPVADHAAEALAALGDKEAAPALNELLDMPDPSAPTIDVRWPGLEVMNEVVRINHLRNCLLCHAPSFCFEQGQPRGLIPVPGLPAPTGTECYSPRACVSREADWVRADITYIKQDFSARQPVAHHGTWPEVQRFDFFVRIRRASENEICMARVREKAHGTYPQRDAVLFALRELKSKDPTTTPDQDQPVVMRDRQRLLREP